MLATLQRLGVVPSFSRQQVSNDNPYSEALFRNGKADIMFSPGCLEIHLYVEGLKIKILSDTVENCECQETFKQNY